MRFGIAFALGAALGSVLVACSSFGATSDEPATPASPDGSAEGSADGPAEASADAGMPASLLEGSDFEVPGCLRWSSNEATLTDDMTAHGGARSCRVCGIDGQTVWSIYQRFTGATAGSYVAEAWVRAAPGAQAATSMFIGLESNDGQSRIDGRENAGTALGDQWQKLTTSLKVQDGDAIDVGILSRGAGGCFLVDDAVLYRAP